MTPVRPIVALCALGLASMPSFAATADDAAGLRAELDALKADYATRIGALEARIAQLEAAASNARQPAPAASAPPADATRSAATAFNPAISLIIGGSYTATSRNPDDWRLAGFMPAGGETGPGDRSFNLGESELTLAANVDPYFSATMTAAISGENEIEVEEAFFRTLALPAGFSAKGGRFFSAFGYLNEVHAHAWDFVDQPLVYQAFFGNQMAQDGLQVKWLAPTDLFLEFGAEAGNGDAFPATHRQRNGVNATALFAHVGGDLGVATSWRAGAAWLDQRATDRAYDDIDALGNPVIDAFSGTARTWIFDAVLKWTPGDATRRQLKLQGEYMRRSERGALAYDVDALDLAGGYRSEQSGWYLQGVYQFNPRWRAGLRYDALDSGASFIGLVDDGTLPVGAFPRLRVADPDRVSLMLDWNPSEFTRLRVQVSRDEARADGDPDRQLKLQYLHGIGAHGAHKY
ncbi:MAG: hypothetical protein CMLOHMNK_01570 [Steroidobacteraceae bacterium]|nr:hypothetical protein [Steroidobacteraceae bacterium]